MKAKFLSLLIVLILTSCYDKSCTIFYKTLDGEQIHQFQDLPFIKSHSYSMIEGCYVIELEDGTTTFGQIFESEADLTKIIVPTCISQINENAFRGCCNLSQIELPEKVDIKANAFAGCTNLKEFHLSNKTTIINKTQFIDCANLRNVTLPEGLVRIEEGAFANCAKLDSIILPESLTSINQYAFANCTSISTITLPKNLIYIADNAFEGCSNLKKVTIQCNKIGRNFCNLPRLKDIVIDNTDNILEISKDAFIGTEWYNNQPDGLIYYDNLLLGYKGELPDSVIIKEGCNYIPASFFKGDNVKYVEIPTSITTIPDSMFYGCETLESVKMHNDIQKIGNYAFSNCTSLHNMNLPTTLTELGKGTFAGCENLENIEIPAGVTKINSYTFSGCNNLLAVELPDSMDVIGFSAFSDCSNLAIIDLPDTLTELAVSAFKGCNKLDPESRMVIRTKTIRNGKVLYSNVKDKVPYLIYLESENYNHRIYCEKYYASNTDTILLYKDGEEFTVVEYEPTIVNNKLTYKTEKGTSTLQNLTPEEVYCQGRCVAILTGYRCTECYITHIDSPGIMYRIDSDWWDDNNNFEPAYRNYNLSLWDLPGFYDTFWEYDANACLYLKQKGVNESWRSEVLLHTNGKIKKVGKIKIAGEEVPVSYIGTPQIKPYYIRAIKEFIKRFEPIPQIIPESIYLLDLYEDCQNAAKEDKHIGKLYSFNVTVKRIEHSNEYKYRLACEDKFGGGYDWFGSYSPPTFVECFLYTDDESFSTLSLPCRLRVKGKFNGTNSFYNPIFIDCELVY